MWPETHQGAGLLRWAAGRGTRVLPVLSHPGASLELEVLWQLGSTLQRLGYDTLVLDACAQESSAEPGLAQWIAPSGGGAPERAGGLLIAPAAQGFDALLGPGLSRPGQARLAQALAPFDVVWVYGRPQQVAVWCAREPAVSPLVINVPGDAALLRSYALLKQMAALAPLRCTLGAVAPRAGDLAGAQRVLRLLEQRSREWLGASVRAVAVDGSDEEALQAFALQLVEAAWLLPTAAPERGERPWMPVRAVSRYHDHSVI